MSSPNPSAPDSNSPKFSIKENLRDGGVLKRAYYCAFITLSISSRKRWWFPPMKMGDVMG